VCPLSTRGGGAWLSWCPRGRQTPHAPTTNARLITSGRPCRAARASGARRGGGDGAPGGLARHGAILKVYVRKHHIRGDLGRERGHGDVEEGEKRVPDANQGRHLGPARARAREPAASAAPHAGDRRHRQRTAVLRTKNSAVRCGPCPRRVWPGVARARARATCWLSAQTAGSLEKILPTPPAPRTKHAAMPAASALPKPSPTRCARRAPATSAAPRWWAMRTCRRRPVAGARRSAAPDARGGGTCAVGGRGFCARTFVADATAHMMDVRNQKTCVLPRGRALSRRRRRVRGGRFEARGRAAPGRCPRAWRARGRGPGSALQRA
jgi:hypothetical protein